MSWSFSGVGKPLAVAKKAKTALASYKCAEPEETIKAKVSEIIETSLTAFPSDMAVQIDANGSQSSSPAGGFSNSLSFTIKPLYGFIEE